VSGERRQAPAWVMPTVAVVAGLIALVSIGGPGEVEEPLDPRSDGRLGTSALVALADDLGADVDVTDRLPEARDGTDVFLMFTDQLTEDQHRQVEQWVRQGGTLVVADPVSQFTPFVGESFTDVEDLDDLPGGTSDCDVTPLEGIDVQDIEPRRGGTLYHVPAGADSCLGNGEEAYVVVSPERDGTVVAVGGYGMFANTALDEGENAPVVAALVAPTPDTDLAVLRPGPVAGSGEDTLVDLISPNVRRFLAQLVIAFVVYALWRSRRLGAPVAEPQPVAVAGSELVAAVGSLLDRSGSPQHAADTLRADLHRFLADRLGVPPDTPPPVLAGVAAERTSVDVQRVAWALGPSPVTDDDQLVALAQTIDAIRQEVLTHV
jgi:hypothetical protein